MGVVLPLRLLPRTIFYSSFIHPSRRPCTDVVCCAVRCTQTKMPRASARSVTRAYMRIRKALRVASCASQDGIITSHTCTHSLLNDPEHIHARFRNCSHPIAFIYHILCVDSTNLQSNRHASSASADGIRRSFSKQKSVLLDACVLLPRV